MELLETLLKVEQQRRDAWLHRDKAALAVLLDEEFVEINYFGRLSKCDLLNDLFDRLHLHEFTIEQPRLHGPAESPVLTYFCFERLSVDENSVEGHFHIASHFLRREGGWKILLWQITPCRTRNDTGKDD
jgi:hypothetical protein